MNTLEFIVAKMNEMLEVEQFNNELFSFFKTLLEEKFNFEFRLIDFEFYNEERLHQAKTEKKKGVKSQDFEYTAKYRELERSCLKCLDYKAEWKIDKSVFLPEPGRELRIIPTPDYLFYCHFGTAANDNSVKEFFDKTIGV